MSAKAAAHAAQIFFDAAAGRESVPVRTTVAVISARPGVECATIAFPLRKLKLRRNF